MRKSRFQLSSRFHGKLKSVSIFRILNRISRWIGTLEIENVSTSHVLRAIQRKKIESSDLLKNIF